jgi:hypothetical protein
VRQATRANTREKLGFAPTAEHFEFFAGGAEGFNVANVNIGAGRLTRESEAAQ